jgi:hypothetical protein
VTERTCKECGKHMTEGYCIEGGMEYYCTKEHLEKHMTWEKFLELYDDGDGDSYWTTFHDAAAPTTAPPRPPRIDKVTIGFERSDGDIEVLATLNNGGEVIDEATFIRLAGKVRDLIRDADYIDAEIYAIDGGSLDIIETGDEYHQPIDPHDPRLDFDYEDDATTGGGK